jgi:prepilin-type N-terminal cleavage/methylation domain-containing protein
LAKSDSSSNAGFSLLEVLVATALLATALVSLAQLFAVATRSNIGSRNSTYAAILAQQKLEELRSLAWGFDQVGLPISDISTDTTVTPETPAGGTGLSPSPSSSLQSNTQGWVDFVDGYGNKVNNPGNALYARRWNVAPLPTNPNNTLVIQVLVYRVTKDRLDADAGSVRRLPEEARMITVKTRKAR